MFRPRSRRQRIFAILMLLGLLFQVQTVLACQMMGATVPAEHCCCEGMAQKRAENSSTGQNDSHERIDSLELNDGLEQTAVKSNLQTGDSCCVLDAELTLKEPDLGRDLPAIIQPIDDLELPEISVYLLLAAIWPEDLADSGSHVSWTYAPRLSLPGTKTYLSTQRLRI